MQRVISSKDVHDLHELIDALQQIGDAPLETPNALEAIYVYGPNGNHVSVKLVETTLSDGSHVYDVTLGEQA